MISVVPGKIKGIGGYHVVLEKNVYSFCIFLGYISRSVAGSYDNEGIAIFCMLLTYTLWIKSVKTGSVFWSTLCALAYFYMV